MASSDILGWVGLLAVAAGVATLVYFITRTNRRLEKVLGDGTGGSLRRLDEGSANFAQFDRALSELAVGSGSRYKIGCVYALANGRSFLASVTEVTKSGSERTYSRYELYLYRGATGVAEPLIVTPGLGATGLGTFATKMLERLGGGVQKNTAGLLPEFRERYMVLGGRGGQARGLTEGVQRAFVRAANRRAGFDPVRGLAGLRGVRFGPEFFLVQISPQWKLSTEERVREFLGFSREIENGIRLG